MKRQLLCVAAFLFVLSLKAQVGIGTKTPNKSAELTIISKDKGLLIPSITLESTGDTQTISNGNVESLVVYASKKQGDILPGFYYWNATKWVRIVSDVDISDLVIKNFEEIVKNETVQNLINKTGGNVFYDGTRFEYLDRSGSRIELLLSTIVKANETVTTLLTNTDGTYTYKSENGTETIIDIPASVANNFETIVNNNPEKVKEIIEKVAKDVEGNVTYNGTDLVYKDATGADQVINLDQLVKANETVTTLLANTDGTYTYKSENGTETIIDIPASVANNFETIVNNNPEKVKEIIEQVAKDVEGNVTYNGTDLVYKDATGADQVINLDQLVKANETVTTLLSDGNGKYTYKSENGTETIINVPESVIETFETIIADNNVKSEIRNLFTSIGGGNVYFNGTVLEYTDESGDRQALNLTSFVKSSETVTKLIDNTDGTYTYYNESGIDATGLPIQNAGVTFKVPNINSHILTGFISSGTYTEKSYDYSTMAYQGTGGIFFNTNAIAGEVFRASITTNSKPANTKYLQLMFDVETNISTIGGYIGNNEVYAKVEFRVLVNDIEVKRFVDRFYRYGGYNFGMNTAYDSYVALIPLDNVTNLSNNNTVKVTVRPASSTFNKNVGTSDGSFRAGNNKAVAYKVKDVVIQVFEK